MAENDDAGRRSVKLLGIPPLPTMWRAHVAIPGSVAAANIISIPCCHWSRHRSVLLLPT